LLIVGAKTTIEAWEHNQPVRQWH